MQGDVVDIHHVTFKALAEATVGVFKNRELTLAVTAFDGEGIFKGQGLKGYCAQFIEALLRQVAFALEVNEYALQQKFTVGIGVQNFGFTKANFVEAGHGGLGDAVDSG